MRGRYPHIEEVMQISQVTQAYATEIQKNSGVQKNIPKEEKSKKSFNLTLSREGIEKSAKASEAAAAQKAQSDMDVRWEMVNQAKEKVAQGYYNTQEFSEELAGKLTNEFGVSE